ncbi:protein kinase domain-containing protein, partial [Actinomadura soli]|uniref:protein kinase domain-containing protein n=1 Tax=Actinomadura soli TaxID=2508997 RepID=UPI00197ADE5B
MTPREHRLPGYVELAELGTGAQGEVVLARHESGGGPVAIKYLATGLLGDPAARSTFRDEAVMLKRVNDPHVARLLDYLESPWGAAIILEAVPGRSLRRILDEHDGPLAPEAALATLKGSLLGLARPTRPGSSIGTTSPRTSSSGTTGRASRPHEDHNDTAGRDRDLAGVRGRHHRRNPAHDRDTGQLSGAKAVGARLACGGGG